MEHFSLPPGNRLYDSSSPTTALVSDVAATDAPWLTSEVSAEDRRPGRLRAYAPPHGTIHSPASDCRTLPRYGRLCGPARGGVGSVTSRQGVVSAVSSRGSHERQDVCDPVRVVRVCLRCGGDRGHRVPSSERARVLVAAESG